MTEGTPRRKKICIVATTPFSLKWFMAPLINLLCAEYNVTIVTSGTAEDLTGLLNDHIAFIPLHIERKVSIKNDIISLVRLWRLFKKERFDCVHSIMPKSGFLAMLAARLAGVPLRIHTFTGQVWATKKGLFRHFLRLLDKILVMNATRVLADSHSQRNFLIKNHVVKESLISVLADGSIAGVNVNRFKYNGDDRVQIRMQNNIPDNAVVFLYVGRLNKDKGLLDLACAFESAANSDKNIHLFIVGPDEEGIDAELAALVHCFPDRVHRAGVTDCPEKYMSAADVLCLPSYREGFGSVIIQAASVGLPAIASRIYGITDAVEDGVTGILHPPGGIHELVKAMLLFSSNEVLRRSMGIAARNKVIDKFSEERVTNAFADFYHDIFRDQV